MFFDSTMFSPLLFSMKYYCSQEKRYFTGSLAFQKSSHLQPRRHNSQFAWTFLVLILGFWLLWLPYKRDVITSRISWRMWMWVPGAKQLCCAVIKIFSPRPHLPSMYMSCSCALWFSLQELFLGTPHPPHQLLPAQKITVAYLRDRELHRRLCAVSHMVQRKGDSIPGVSHPAGLT